MADVLNTFEGGSNGTTITTGNSGGASGNAFNFVSTVAGGSSTYITTAYRGTLAGQFSSGATAGTALAEYTTAVGSSSSGGLYARVRFRLPVLPPDTTGTRVIVITDSVGAFVAELRVISTGAVSIRGSGGSALATFSLTYAAGAWWDVGLAITTFSSTVGVIEGKRYAADGTVAQTITSAATQNTLASGGTNKCQVGQIRSITNLTVQVDDVAWSTTAYPATAVAPTVVNGPWWGAVTDTGWTAAWKLGATASARMVVSASSDLSSPVYSSAVAPDSDGFVKLAIAGLTADTAYYYGVEADGLLLSTGRGQARTFPGAGTAASFSIGFGSCNFDAPSDGTMTALAAYSGSYGRLRQIVHMGDMNYKDWDGTATAAQIRTQHMANLGSAAWATALSTTALNYLWDNHDWGGDTSDRTAAAGDLVAAAYRQIFPHYTLPASNSRGGYHTWTIGRVRFIQLDVRSYRDPQAQTNGPTKTMLGTEQKSWLATLLAGAEPVKILCANYPWRDGTLGDGRWGSYPDEFADLNATIAASNSAGRIFVLSGDRHFLAADNGTTTGTHGIPQAGGAPFQQATVAVTETWSQGSYTLGGATMQAYGILDVADTGTTITLTYSGKTTADGTERVAMTTVFSPVAAASLPVTATLTAGAAVGRTAGAALAVSASLSTTASSNRQVIDDFNDNTISADWNTSAGGGQVAETGGAFRISTTLASGFYSAVQIPEFDIAERYVTVRVVSAGNQSLASYTAIPLGARFSATNDAYWLITGNQAACYTVVAGAATFRNVMTYTPGTHNYLAIGVVAGQLVWQWSSDAVSWTVLHTMASPYGDTTMSPYAQVGTGSAEASTTTLVLDDLGLQPIGAAALTAAAALPVVATLAAGAQRNTPATAALAVTVALTPSAARSTTAAGTLAVTTTLAPAGTVGTAPIIAAAALPATATLTTTADHTAPAGPNLTVTATFTTTAAVTARPAVAISATATLSTTASTGLTPAGAVVAVLATLIATAGGYARYTARPYAGVTLRP